MLFKSYSLHETRDIIYGLEGKRQSCLKVQDKKPGGARTRGRAVKWTSTKVNIYPYP